MLLNQPRRQGTPSPAGFFRLLRRRAIVADHARARVDAVLDVEEEADVVVDGVDGGSLRGDVLAQFDARELEERARRLHAPRVQERFAARHLA